VVVADAGAPLPPGGREPPEAQKLALLRELMTFITWCAHAEAQAAGGSVPHHAHLHLRLPCVCLLARCTYRVLTRSACLPLRTPQPTREPGAAVRLVRTHTCAIADILQHRRLHSHVTRALRWQVCIR
jgi:hypothetical protein